jgi:hypothetical protein
MTAEPTKPKETTSQPKPKSVKAVNGSSPAKARRTKSTSSAVATAAPSPVTLTDTPTMPSPVVADAMDTDKGKKARKQKLVRDSFKFPHQEYAAFDTLKARCLKAGHAIKKSELVRAGLVALLSLNDEQLIELLGKLEKLKAGRPAK